MPTLSLFVMAVAITVGCSSTDPTTNPPDEPSAPELAAPQVESEAESNGDEAESNGDVEALATQLAELEFMNLDGTTESVFECDIGETKTDSVNGPADGASTVVEYVAADCSNHEARLLYFASQEDRDSAEIALGITSCPQRNSPTDLAEYSSTPDAVFVISPTYAPWMITRATGDQTERLVLTLSPRVRDCRALAGALK